MNISIAIADSNREYVERLAEGLQQYPELTIHIYTSGRSLQTALDINRFDVVLFDPDISDERLNFSGVGLPICLYYDGAKRTGLYADVVKIIKYQRISVLYKEMIREYSKEAGYSAEFDHSQNTKIVAVYSPVGGSGKTTVALAIASQLASQGKSVLFVSVEQLGSFACVNPCQEEGLVALVESLSDAKVNFELKLKGIVKQGFGGMSYLEGFERLADYDATTGEEIKEVLQKIKRCGIWDVLVIDMESCFHAIERIVFEVTDRIVLVEKTGELPAVKMALFSKQGIFNEFKTKMVRICNFADAHSRFCPEIDLSAAGMIHNYGNLQLGNMIRSINANGEVRLDVILGK